MSDFDFDELDRAVNSVIGQQGAPSDDVRSTDVHSRVMPGRPESTPAPRPIETAAPTTPTQVSSNVDVSQSPAVTSQTPRPEERAQTQAPASSPIALPRRRSGRFMDVVHPSSDMRSSASTIPARRTGVSLQPVTTTPDASPVATDSVIAQNSEAAVAPAFRPTEPQLTIDESEVETEAPREVDNNPGDAVPLNSSLEAAINDLLVSEGHNPVGDHSVEASVPATEAPQADVVVDETVDVTEDELKHAFDDVQPFEPESPRPENPDELSLEDILTSDQPQVSPFIEGAKVEKRPLGAYTPLEELETEFESEMLEGEQSKTDIASVEVSEEVIDDPSLDRTELVNADGSLPEELDQSLMSIETVEEDAAPDATTPAEIATEKPLDASAETDVDTTNDDKVTTTKEEPSTGPTSIPQQYKVEPRDKAEDETGDIFDTTTYHQPIKGEDKKPSPLPWIIGIIILALLIAGGAFFAWWSGMFVAPM